MHCTYKLSVGIALCLVQLNPCSNTDTGLKLNTRDANGWVDPDRMDRRYNKQDNHQQGADIPTTPKEWVDPDDMDYFDRRTKSMLNSKQEWPSFKNGAPYNYTLVNRYFKRIVNLIVKSIHEISDGNHKLSLQTSVDKNDVDLLLRLAQTENFDDAQTLLQLDELFSRLFEHSTMDKITQYTYPWYDLSMDSIKSLQTPIWLVAGGILLMLFTRARGDSHARISYSACVALVAYIAYLWTYYHLVEEEEQKLLNRQLKCYTHGGFLTWLWGGSDVPDEVCTRQLKSVPLSIHPTKVLMEMFREIVKGVSYPLIDGFMYLIQGVKNEFPWPLNWLAMFTLPLSVLVVFVFSLTLLIKQRIALGFFYGLISFSMSSDTRHEPVRVTTSSRDAIQNEPRVIEVRHSFEAIDRDGRTNKSKNNRRGGALTSKAERRGGGGDARQKVGDKRPQNNRFHRQRSSKNISDNVSTSITKDVQTIAKNPVSVKDDMVEELENFVVENMVVRPVQDEETEELSTDSEMTSSELLSDTTESEAPSPMKVEP